MSTLQKSLISQNILDEALSYEEYSELTERLYQEGRTTNDDNSESMLHYTMLNMQRTARWNKRGKLNDSLVEVLETLPNKMIWLVITEGWCGDASQVLPFIQKMAESTEQIELKLILRDQYPEVMEHFLTKGTRAIPKLVMLDANSLDMLGVWGPRPAIVHDDHIAKLRDPNFDNKKASEELHIWYARDKGRAVQGELEAMLKSIVV